jgi:hypothetical protein
MHYNRNGTYRVCESDCDKLKRYRVILDAWIDCQHPWQAVDMSDDGYTIGE